MPRADIDLPLARPADDHIYYGQLAAGARFLAAEAESRVEREEHLAMVRRYARMQDEALGSRQSRSTMVTLASPPPSHMV